MKYPRDEKELRRLVARLEKQQQETEEELVAAEWRALRCRKELGSLANDLSFARGALNLAVQMQAKKQPPATSPTGDQPAAEERRPS